MSSHDKRYDNSAPWKSHRSEFSNRDSPERNRKRNSDSPTRRYHSYKDRRQYDNRSWNYGPNAKRHSYEHSRSTHGRMPETSDEKKQHEAEKAEIRTTESDSRNVTSKSTWSSNSPSVIPNPKRSPLLMDPKPLITAPLSADHFPQTSFKLIFQHINAVYNQSDQSQQARPMSFIDRLIADEAMRMLSAASYNEVTSLNEPCDVAEVVPSDVTFCDATETSKQQEKQVVIASKIDDKVATVSAADSALLQKSAEQVTKKLINQLSTMNKYDLKHMIDNPAGKYETALNRHAQSKLRAEVRKQLKSFGLGKLGTSCVTDDGTVESDEAIDAEKIPPALLEQIGQALDLDLFDLSQPESTESNEQLPNVVENPTSNSNEPDSKGEHESHALKHTPSSTKHSSTEHNAKQNVTNHSGSPRKMSTKNRNALKSSPLKPGHTKKIIIRKANATIRDAGRTPVASTLQPKAVKSPVSKNNSKVAVSKNMRDENIGSDLAKTTVAIPLVVPIVQSSRFISQIGQAKSTDTHEGQKVNSLDKEQATNNKVNSLDKEQATNNKVNSLDNINPIPADINSGVKNMSLLRVSTVEELNRRLDEHPSVKGIESQRVAEFNPTNVASERRLSQEDIPNASELSAQIIPIRDSITSLADEVCNTFGANDPTESTAGNSSINSCRWQSTLNHKNNAYRPQSPTIPAVQQKDQLNSSNDSFHVDQFDSIHLFTSFSTPKKHTESAKSAKADNRTLSVVEGENSMKTVLLKHVLTKAGEKRARISMDEAAEISNVPQTHSTTPKVIGDQSKTPVIQPLLPVLNSQKQLPVKEGNTLKKRNGFLPSLVCSSGPSNDTMASNPMQLQNMEHVCGDVMNRDQSNETSPTVKLSKKRKKRKASRFEPANNTKNINNVAEVFNVNTTERIPTLQSAEEIPNEDHILNNAYDQYLNKSLVDRAPETVEKQTHMTIAKVCSISVPEEMGTSRSAITVSSIDEATSTNSSGLQLPLELSIFEPKKEEAITTSQNSEQSVQNGASSDNCTDGNLPEWNLPTESIAESKEGIERIVSPPTTEQLSNEYILGGDSGEKCVPSQTLPDSSPSHQEEQTPNVGNHSANPQPTDHTARLQSLCEITERMAQTLEEQTMELYNRKMQIDAQLMQLQAERMDIDQQLERMQQMRSEQINFVRLNLLELLSANGSNGSTMQAESVVTSNSSSCSNGIPMNQSVPSGPTQAGVRQQERTIRRITPIGGNSVLMNIFKRRRAPSERSTEENPPVVDHAQ